MFFLPHEMKMLGHNVPTVLQSVMQEKISGCCYVNNCPSCWAHWLPVEWATKEEYAETYHDDNIAFEGFDLNKLNFDPVQMEAQNCNEGFVYVIYIRALNCVDDKFKIGCTQDFCDLDKIKTALYLCSIGESVLHYSPYELVCCT